MRKALRLSLVLLQIPTALLVLYLDVLTAAAALWRPQVALDERRRRFAIIIPAHNEELLLPRLLTSCWELAYPRELFDVYVIADNCSDRTAEIAHEGGAMVHERTDIHLRGKGYALNWLLKKLAGTHSAYDAYVIVDADSVVATSMLEVFNAHLAKGDQVIQCYYGVQNRDQSWPAMLRHVALVLYNGIRPRGRDMLGLSAGLRGNGMCFASPVIEQFGWNAASLAEDAEFHLHLLGAGIRVRYAPQTTVTADMPVTLRQARTQNARWERGRLQLARAHGSRLLAEGIVQRDPAKLDALAELILPPLSVLGALAAVGLAISSLFRARMANRLALLNLVGLVWYMLGGLFIARERPRAYFSLLMAPAYAVWKIGVYIMSALRIKDSRWLRTARSSAEVVKRS